MQSAILFFVFALHPFVCLNFISHLYFLDVDIFNKTARFARENGTRWRKQRRGNKTKDSRRERENSWHDRESIASLHGQSVSTIVWHWRISFAVTNEANEMIFFRFFCKCQTSSKFDTVKMEFPRHANECNCSPCNSAANMSRKKKRCREFQIKKPQT